MPSAIRASKFSLKTNQANSAVRTPSRFRSNDADAADVDISPNMSATGPRAPPSKMAPESHRQSRFVGMVESTDS